MSARRVAALLLAFAVLSAGECSLGDLADLLARPGTITVTNASAAESAVLAITTDDARSYPTLGPGQSATVTTNVSGTYRVSVAMTPENMRAYQLELRALRGLVERQISGDASPVEKTQLFIKLAGIKAAILALEQGNGAGCSGQIKLTTDAAASVRVTVKWVTQGDSGFWDPACG
jgi:hypothetical protein